MKGKFLRAAILVAAFVSMGQHTFAQSSDKNLVLKDLWKKWSSAYMADKVKQEAEVLSQIRSEALRNDYALDFYTAWVRTVSNGSRQNWKLRDSLERSFARAAADYPAPIMGIFYLSYKNGESPLSLVREHEAELRAGCHRDLMTASAFPFPDAACTDLVANDYQFALWVSTRRDTTAYALLKKEYAGINPQEALVDYLRIMKIGDQKRRCALLCDFDRRHSGEAVHLYARRTLLNDKMNRLCADKETSSETFISLRTEISGAEKEKKSYSGLDARLVCGQDFKSMADRLDAKSASVIAYGGKIIAYVRNVGQLKFALIEGKKTLWSATVKNTVRSYYKLDSLVAELPSTLDDGSYELVYSGDVTGSRPYTRYSVSVCRHTLPDGTKTLYAADDLTGEPFDNSRLSEVTSSRYAVRYQLTDDRGRFRSSEELYNYPDLPVAEPSESRDLLILPSCAAYNRGDTLRFKVIAWKVSPSGEASLLPEGTEVKMTVTDAEGKVLGRQTLHLGRMGSASGEYAVSGKGVGGAWRIESVTKGLESMCSVIVDDFVLPDYTLEFDKAENLYFQGDDLRVSGCVSAWSGHSLEGARLRCRCDDFTSELVLSPDGHFSFIVPGKAVRGTPLVNVTVISPTGETHDFRQSRFSSFYPHAILESKNVTGNASVRFELKNDMDMNVDLPVHYVLCKEGVPVDSACVRTNVPVILDLSSWTSGVFSVRASVDAGGPSGDRIRSLDAVEFVKLPLDAAVLDIPASGYCQKIDSEAISFRIGDACKPLWALVQLWGRGGELLRSEIVHVNGRKGEVGNLRRVDWEYLPDYPDELVLTILWFRDGKCINQEFSYERRIRNDRMPLTFSRFTSEASPGSICSVGLWTSPGAECAVSVFDKASESIRDNSWMKIYLPEISRSRASSSRIVCGTGAIYSRDIVLWNVVGSSKALSETVVVGYGRAKSSSRLNSVSELSEEEFVPDIHVRSDLRSNLYFNPSIPADGDGNASFSFRCSDKLSTFVVQVYAHDSRARSAVERREVRVCLPLQLTVMPIDYLYEGDTCRLACLVSNSGTEKLSGRMTMKLYRETKWEDARLSVPLSTVVLDSCVVEAGGNSSFCFDIAPEQSGEYGVMLSYADGQLSDAYFFPLTVHEAAQIITESHSAVLRSGDDRQKLIAELSSLFVNGQAQGAEVKEISIIDMVREALPSLQEPVDEDALSQMAAYYSNVLSAHLSGVPADTSVQNGIMRRILSMRNPDGGFAWISGLDSSPAVTASLLHSFAGLKKRGLAVSEDFDAVCADACRYLDKEQFSSRKVRPCWCGGLSLEQYLLVRSEYPQIKRAAVPSYKTSVAIRRYLEPRRNRGLQGNVFGKARRMLTLANKGKTKSLNADYESLYEYAQPHRDGARYFPNAVLPFRGLLESEAFAHALICDLFASAPEDNPKAAEYAALADDLRLWMMLQKETQHWAADPGYVDALASILDGSEPLLDTRILVMTKRFLKPFDEVKPSSNGFVINCRYSLEEADDKLTEIKDGDTLHVGDKVVATYEIDNAENRSFVRLLAPRPACMRPVDQISGRYGWGLKPLRVENAYLMTPRGYRWVRADRSEYWFEYYPEEKSSVTESFFVSREGVFSAPAPVIESLYAPHYRANSRSIRSICLPQKEQRR